MLKNKVLIFDFLIIKGFEELLLEFNLRSSEF